VPSPVASRSKAKICDRSRAVIAGSNLARGMDVCLFCQMEVSATVRSRAQRSRTDCGVSLCVSINLKDKAAMARVRLLRQIETQKILKVLVIALQCFIHLLS
jgi:hypothetical protein